MEYLEHLSASTDKQVGKYDYGVDEYFMNTYLLRHFYKTRTPYYVFINSPDANNMLSGYIPYLRTLQQNGNGTGTGKLNHQAVAEFTDLFAKTVGVHLDASTPENTIDRLDTLRDKLAPFGTVQPVKDQQAKQALAKFMSTKGQSAHLVPNLQRCIFNNFNFDKSADMIKRITPSIKKSKKSSVGRTGRKSITKNRTQKRAPRK